MCNFKNQKGSITLFALVSSLFFIASVACVSMYMQSKQVAVDREYRQVKENYEVSIEKIKKQGKILSVNTTLFAEDNVVITIPAGFTISKESPNVASEGIIITDSVDGEGNSNGNEFVWVPVTDENSYKTNTTYGASYTLQNDTGYLPDEIQVGDGQDFEKEKELVISNGGFYISRYEAGKEGEKKLVSKKGASVWININQETAKKTAKTFINNNQVKSGLVTGAQWDMVMAFLSSKTRLDGEGQSFDVTKYLSNRHKGETVGAEESGQNEYDKVCNIYDLEGNCVEYVAEKNDNTGSPYIWRGGNYKYNYPASYRSSSSGSNGVDLSFRFVLYIM